MCYSDRDLQLQTNTIQTNLYVEFRQNCLHFHNKTRIPLWCGTFLFVLHKLHLFSVDCIPKSCEVILICLCCLWRNKTCCYHLVAVFVWECKSLAFWTKWGKRFEYGFQTQHHVIHTQVHSSIQIHTSINMVGWQITQIYRSSIWLRIFPNNHSVRNKCDWKSVVFLNLVIHFVITRKNTHISTKLWEHNASSKRIEWWREDVQIVLFKKKTKTLNLLLNYIYCKWIKLVNDPQFSE